MSIMEPGEPFGRLMAYLELWVLRARYIEHEIVILEPPKTLGERLPNQVDDRHDVRLLHLGELLRHLDEAVSIVPSLSRCDRLADPRARRQPDHEEPSHPGVRLQLAESL